MKFRCLWFALFAIGAALTTWTILGQDSLAGETAADAPIAVNSESFIYVLELANTRVGEFTECSGLGSYHEVEEQVGMTSTGSLVVKSTPGVLHWGQITLRRAAPSDVAIWQWRQTMEEEGLSSALRTGRILLYGPGSSTPLVKWTFTAGWPASLILDGAGEELVIVHEGIEREGTGASTGGTTTRS